MKQILIGLVPLSACVGLFILAPYTVLAALVVVAAILLSFVTGDMILYVWRNR